MTHKRLFLAHPQLTATLQARKELTNDGTVVSLDDGNPYGCDNSPVTMRVFDGWLFVKIASEYDLGLADPTAMAGPHFVVESLCPLHERDETNVVIGDLVGLTCLLLLVIGN
jgi:cyclopropane-fatty-acyl-phospholipid synthase